MLDENLIPFIFIALALAGFLIACLTGKLLTAIIVSTLAGCILLNHGLFTADELTREFIGVPIKTVADGILIRVWFVICFSLMPVAAISGIASFLGIKVRSLTRKTKKPEIYLCTISALVVAASVFFSVFLLMHQKANRDCQNVIASQGKSFILQQEQVLIKTTGPISEVLNCNPSNVKLDYLGKGLHGILFYTLGGPQGESHVSVEVSGTKNTPKFSVKEVYLIAHSQKYPLH